MHSKGAKMNTNFDFPNLLLQVSK